MDYFPIHLDIRNKKCLVIGAGDVAYRKIKMLMKAGAEVHCISSQWNQEIRTLAEAGEIHYQSKTLHPHLDFEFLQGYRLIVSATPDRELSEAIYKHCEKHQLLLNTVDQQDLCQYITPAVIDRNPVLVSVSSSGTAPVLARKIRLKIEKLLPFDVGHLARKSKQIRQALKSYVIDKKLFWETYYKYPSLSKTTGGKKTVDEVIGSVISRTPKTGRVSLVGAGPGAPELLTLKALNVMQEADIVYHDKLVSPEILDLVRRDAKLVSVGKSLSHHSVPQEQINQLLIQSALEGKQVCRLKGGDPFVFGRGGEEVEELQKHNIPFEIVPGITAAVGCASYSGIPLTHRNHSQCVLFITAHCKQSQDTLDWKSLAREKQTIAVYMGLMKSSYLAEQLIHYGKRPQTPVAVIENGTLPHQRVVTGELRGLADLINSHNIQSPAMIFIGEVVDVASNLNWFESQAATTKIQQHLKIA